MKWIIANLGSIGMALFLAVITWVYLWAEAASTVELRLPFAPQARAENIARIDYALNGESFLPSDGITAKFIGPRAQIEAVERGLPPCVPIFDAARFAQDKASFTYEIQPKDFALPDTIRFVGKQPILTVTYVKLVEQLVPVLATADNVEGRAMLGFRVQKIIPRTEKVRVLAPADADYSAGLPIENVRLAAQNNTFTAPGRLKLPPGVRRLEDFFLDVVVVPRPDIRVYSGIAVHLLGPNEIVRRLQLESPLTIDISVTGPLEILEKLGPGDFAAYAEAEIAPAELVAGARLTLKTIRCHLKRKVEGQIDITPMHEVKPENRQAVVLVLPAR